MQKVLGMLAVAAVLVSLNAAAGNLVSSGGTATKAVVNSFSESWSTVG